VEVTKSTDTFQVVWRIGGQTQHGTGVLTGENFSVAYQQQGASPGIAVYERGGDGGLTGTWAPIGSSGQKLTEFTKNDEPTGGSAT